MKKLFIKCLISKDVFCISRDLSQDEIGKGKILNTLREHAFTIYNTSYFHQKQYGKQLKLKFGKDVLNRSL